MRKFTAAIALSFIGSIGFSQDYLPGAPPMQVFTISKTPEKHTGSPYLEQNFVNGTINDDKGKTHNAYLRYNAVEDVVEIKIENTAQSEILVLPKIKSLSYSLKDYKYILDSFRTDKGEKIEGFLIEYYNGKSFGLYGNPLPNISEAQVASTGYQQDKPAHLSVQLDYYIKKGDGTLHNVKLRDKDFKNVLPESKELNEYLKENKLKTPQDYANMLKWLDNL